MAKNVSYKDIRGKRKPRKSKVHSHWSDANHVINIKLDFLTR